MKAETAKSRPVKACIIIRLSSKTFYKLLGTGPERVASNSVTDLQAVPLRDQLRRLAYHVGEVCRGIRGDDRGSAGPGVGGCPDGGLSAAQQEADWICEPDKTIGRRHETGSAPARLRLDTDEEHQGLLRNRGGSTAEQSANRFQDRPW